MNSCLIVNCNNLQLVNKKYLTGGKVLFLTINFSSNSFISDVCLFLNII